MTHTNREDYLIEQSEKLQTALKELADKLQEFAADLRAETRRQEVDQR